MQSGMACIVQFLGVGSAAVFFLSGLPLFVAVLVDEILSKNQHEVSLWSYAVGELVPLTIGAQMVFAMLDVFVPLVGYTTTSLVVGLMTYLDRSYGGRRSSRAHRRIFGCDNRFLRASASRTIHAQILPRNSCANSIRLGVLYRTLHCCVLHERRIRRDAPETSIRDTYGKCEFSTYIKTQCLIRLNADHERRATPSCRCSGQCTWLQRACIRYSPAVWRTRP